MNYRIVRRMYRAPRCRRSSFESRIYSIIALTAGTGIIKSRKPCVTINRLFRIIHEITIKYFKSIKRFFCIMYKEEKKRESKNTFS